MSLTETQKGILLTAAVALMLAVSKWALAPVAAVLFLSPTLSASLRATLWSGLQEHRALLIRILIFATPVLFYVLASPPPPDDLLREMTAYLHHFDYRNLYWASPRLMAGDTSYWWSWGLQWLYRTLPLQDAYLPVQYALLCLWAAVPPLVFRRALRLASPNIDDAFAWVIVGGLTILLWISPGFVSRLTQARPENLGAALAIGAFLVESSAGLVLWTLVCAAFLPLYWISFATIPGALIARVPWKQRAWSIGALSLLFSGLWVSGLSGHWISWLSSMPVALAHRVTGVSEDEPDWHLLQSPALWGVLALSALAVSTGPALRRSLHGTSTRDPALPVFFLGLWFLLPDMTRYIDCLAPLALLWVALKMSAETWNRGNRFPVWLGVFTGLFFLLPMAMHTAALPNLKIAGARPGARVLSTLGPEEYFALYENPQLRFAPADELGFTKRRVQILGMDLQRGGATCAELYHYHVSFVAERHVAITPRNGLAQCLKLQRSDQHGYAIWRVVPGAAIPTHGPQSRALPPKRLPAPRIAAW